MNTEALRGMLGQEEHFASVYFDASHDTEDAAKELELRWRAARDRLRSLNTPQRTVAALDEAFARHRPAVGRAGRFLIAAGDTVLLDEYLTAPPVEAEVRLSPVPYLLPLVEAGQPSVPHVVVTVHKRGGSLRASTGAETIAEEVRGREHPVHKVRGGGWSHRNIHRHTEEVVKQNVDEVAAEVTRLAQRIGARLVVLIGDVEQRALLRRELPASIESIAVDAGGEQDVERLAAQVWYSDQAAALERFAAELGRGGLAVQGMRATVAALREANVELLIINTGTLHKQEVWIGFPPSLIATKRSQLRDLGIPDSAGIPADEALPAAALAVGADVLTTDETAPAEGIGALLRHT